MGPFSQVPGLAGYQQQVAFNEGQNSNNLQRIGTLLKLQQMQQQMDYEPQERIQNERLRNAQITNVEGQGADRQEQARKAQEIFTLAKTISAMPQDHPERQTMIQQYKMLANPQGAFAEQKPMIEHNFSVGNDRVQPHISLDNGQTWKPIPGSHPSAKFAKQIPSIVNMGDVAGKAPSGYRATKDGNLEAIPGGPADAKAQAQAALKAGGATDVDLAVSTLRDAYDRLEKGGGITSTDKPAYSNIIPSLSSSGAGQAVGKMLGTANQSARNDIAMTRPALLAALMKATGMSAKQMDSNAELKLWLATATDPTLDVGSNRRALANIEKKYLGAQAAPAAVPAGVNRNITVDW